MRLRQICLVATRLEDVSEDIQEVLGLGTPFVDPGVAAFGLENKVWPLGGNFLEVVAPVAENTAAGRYLSRKGGNCGYMVILQCGDGFAARQRIAAKGVRVAWEIDRPDYVATHFHPRDVGNVILSVDSTDEGDNYSGDLANWAPAGPDWRANVHREVTQDLVGAEIESAAPARMADHWADLLDCPRDEDEFGNPLVRLENGTIRFIPPLLHGSEGLGGIDIRAADRERLLATAAKRGIPTGGDQLELCGTRIYLT